MRRTAGYTPTDYKTNTQIAKELKITPILDKLLEYKRNWIQHVNRMPRNRLPRVMKHYSATGRRNHGRPLKRLLDTWDRNGSSGPTPWQIYDDEFISFDHKSYRRGTHRICNDAIWSLIALFVICLYSVNQWCVMFLSAGHSDATDWSQYHVPSLGTFAK